MSIDGNEIMLDGAKQRTVLAALLLARGHVLSDAHLSGLLWEWDPPATASAQIYTYVSRLRKRLGDCVEIVRQRPGYLLRLRKARFDYQEFERFSHLGRGEAAAGRHEGAADYFRAALVLWPGPTLANVTESLADSAVPELNEARMATLEARIEAELAVGRHWQLVSELTGLVAEYPVREGLRAKLMTALYRSGRQADALASYQDGRLILAEELGIDPGAALNRTHQAVLTGDLALIAIPGGERLRLHVRDLPESASEKILAILADARLFDTTGEGRVAPSHRRLHDLELFFAGDLVTT